MRRTPAAGAFFRPTKVKLGIGIAHLRDRNAVHHSAQQRRRSRGRWALGPIIAKVLLDRRTRCQRKQVNKLTCQP
jgi:hypothetical protein